MVWTATGHTTNSLPQSSTGLSIPSSKLSASSIKTHLLSIREGEETENILFSLKEECLTLLAVQRLKSHKNPLEQLITIMGMWHYYHIVELPSFAYPGE